MIDLGPIKVKLIGGPHDGTDLEWMWNDDEDGHRGAREGFIRLGDSAYQCNDDRTEAHHVPVALRFTCVGGPLDGMKVDGCICNPSEFPNLPMQGNVNFGGLTYWLDRETGIATYVEGKDEAGILKELTGSEKGTFDGRN